MANSSNTKAQSKNGPDYLSIGLLGAVIGAGVAIVGALAMRDDRTSEKVNDVVKTVGDKANEFLDDMKKEATNQLADKVDETADKVLKSVSEKKR